MMNVIELLSSEIDKKNLNEKAIQIGNSNLYLIKNQCKDFYKKFKEWDYFLIDIAKKPKNSDDIFYPLFSSIKINDDFIFNETHIGTVWNIKNDNDKIIVPLDGYNGILLSQLKNGFIGVIIGVFKAT